MFSQQNFVQPVLVCMTTFSCHLHKVLCWLQSTFAICNTTIYVPRELIVFVSSMLLQLFCFGLRLVYWTRHLVLDPLKCMIKLGMQNEYMRRKIQAEMIMKQRRYLICKALTELCLKMSYIVTFVKVSYCLPCFLLMYDYVVSLYLCQKQDSVPVSLIFRFSSPTLGYVSCPIICTRV